MSGTPSYYDSVSLLAICDAIDAIDGIPFAPNSEPTKLPDFRALRPKIARDPLSSSKNKKMPLQHAYLSHIPVSGVVSPVGTIPYEEQQRAIVSQLAAANQLPPPPPKHIAGGKRPSAPVVHNLRSNSKRASHSSNNEGAMRAGMRANMRHDSADMAANNNNNNQALRLSLNLNGVRNNGPPGMHAMPPNIGANKPLNGGPLSHKQGLSQGPSQIPSPNQPQIPPLKFNQKLTSMAMPNSTSQQQAGSPPGPLSLSLSLSHLNESNNGTEPLNYPNDDPMGGYAPGPPIPPVTLRNPMADTSGYSVASSPGSPMDMVPNESGFETCPICGREFKGPKASTHKQQHIRRLHPTEYMPKRGGKKSRPDPIESN